MYPCNSVNSPGRSRRHTVYPSRNPDRIQGTAVSLICWQVSVTQSTRAATGRIQGTVVSLIRNPGRPRRHQVKLSCKSWQTSVTPSQTELQILADLPGRPRRHQVKLSCKSWQTSATLSQTELQILADLGETREANVKCTDKSEGKLDVRRHRHN
ncbi:hypothetical protein L3X38_036780 [Prunus dulcis]|uniref:Uncharacterized protein n=1 Tax=Prunus dulcis TaxID=3755 RepID=A0AAD4V2E4_PRUDU|nr:hypothetical protein L3X38_036780 [Prunus dulcis]